MYGPQGGRGSAEWGVGRVSNNRTVVMVYVIGGRRQG